MDLTEFYYETGKLPDRYYNQLNGKSAQKNYISIKKKKSNFFLDFIKNTMRLTLMRILNELLKEFEQKQNRV